LADLKCWNICILADLTEVVVVIVYRDRNVSSALMPSPRGVQERQSVRHTL